jgi:hypothetical protein
MWRSVVASFFALALSKDSFVDGSNLSCEPDIRIGILWKLTFRGVSLLNRASSWGVRIPVAV